MSEIPITNTGLPQCPGCLAIPPPEFLKLKRFQLLQCPACNDTFVVIADDLLITTMKVDLKVPEPPPE